MKKLSILVLGLSLMLTLNSCSSTAENTTETTIENKEISNKNIEALFKDLEEKYGVTLGIYAINTTNNKEVSFNADERFGYCSTYKALAGAIILQKYKIEELENMVKFSQEDILSYAPVCKDKVETGMTIGEICEAAIRQSDNTAGNLQFKLIGGVDEFEKALREIGDNVTNADRIETELNNVALDDIRDTSTPKQLVENLKAYLSGDILSSDKKSILKDWLSNNQTGDALIRAGAPKDSKVYDKSGAGDYGIRNDIAMVELPNGDKVFVAILSKKQNKDDKYDNKLIEEASRIIFENI